MTGAGNYSSITYAKILNQYTLTNTEAFHSHQNIYRIFGINSSVFFNTDVGISILIYRDIGIRYTDPALPPSKQALKSATAWLLKFTVRTCPPTIQLTSR
jgi:hypothetical protein